MNVIAVVAELFHARHRATHFFATVTAVGAATIQIQRDGQSAPDETYYAASTSAIAAATPGERVLVVDVTDTGGLFVVEVVAV